MLYTKLWYFRRISGDRVGVEHRQCVIPTRFPLVVIVVPEFGIVVGVAIWRDVRERNGGTTDPIGISVEFCGSTEVKDESGDGGAD
jgi:hypothetical protein